MKQKAYYHILFVLIGMLSYLVYLDSRRGIGGFVLSVASVAVYGIILSKIHHATQGRKPNIRLRVALELVLTYLLAFVLNRMILNPIPVLFFLIPILIKNLKGLMKFRVFSAITILLILLIGIYLPVRAFNKPYAVVESTISKLRMDTDYRSNIATEEEFREYEHQYGNLVPFDVNEFRRIMEEEDIVGYETKTPLLLKIRPYGHSSQYIPIYYYDSETGNESGSMALLIDRVNGEWKIIGQLN